MKAKLFGVLQSLLQILATLIFVLNVVRAGLGALVAQVISLRVVVLLSYMINARFVFGKAR